MKLYIGKLRCFFGYHQWDLRGWRIRRDFVPRNQECACNRCGRVIKIEDGKAYLLPKKQ